MKIHEAMRYPHPVLSEYYSDYSSGEFRCAFEQNITASGELRIASDISLINQALSDLISSQCAASGYFIVCRRTYFNLLQEAPIGHSEKFYDLSKFFGTVTLRPVVWTLQPLDNFSSPLFNEEFGKSVSVVKGAIIALGPEFRFSVEQRKFKPFDSIFELGRDDNIHAGTVLVDPDRDRIAILAENNTYSSLANMRNLPLGRSILLSSIYMPAIMEVICRLQLGDSGLENRKWYRVFRAKCDDLAVSPEDPGKSPLELAQKLLREPLKRSISLMEKTG